MNGHIQSAKKGMTLPLSNAIRKYKTFDIIIIEICKSIEELNIREQFYIKQYDCIVDNRKGYNAESGGLNKIPSKATIEKWKSTRGVYTLSEEHKRKISESTKGRIVIISEEQKLKMSISCKGRKTSKETRLKMSNSRKGRITTLETRKKLSIANKGKIISNEVKLKMSNTLKEYYKNNVHPVKGFKRGTCNNKLQKEQVLEIRELLLKGYTTVFIGEQFNISKATILQIKNGITWQSLGEFKLEGRASRLSPDLLKELYLMFDNNATIKQIKSKITICIATIAKQRKLWKQLKEN